MKLNVLKILECIIQIIDMIIHIIFLTIYFRSLEIIKILGTKKNYVAKSIIDNLIGNDIRLQILFTNLKNLFSIISGIVNRETELTESNKTEIHDNIKLTYSKILNFYNDISGNLMGINPKTFLDDTIKEVDLFFEYGIKNIKNIQKIDEETFKVYKNFMNSYLDFNNIRMILKDYYPQYYDNSFNTFNGLFTFLRYFDLMLMDILCITRSIKVFSVKKQAFNLDPKSYCYHQYGLKGRNLLYYSGWAHSNLYYLFWTYYFKRIADLSVMKKLNSENVDYNGLFSYIFSSIPGTSVEKVLNYRDKNTLDRLLCQCYIFQVTNGWCIVNPDYDSLVRKMQLKILIILLVLFLINVYKIKIIF